MHFFLQSDDDCLDKEIMDLKYVLSGYAFKYSQEYNEISKEDIKVAKFGKGVNIPVGTLEFVSSFLEKVKGSGYMKPLEIPKFLQKDEFLKRDYTICKFKDLPKSGRYFLKDASILKNWNAEFFSMPFLADTLPKLQQDWEEHDYVCSEIIPKILSEYRVLVHEDIIVGVQYYSGLRIISDGYDSFSDYIGRKTSGVLAFPDSDLLKEVLNTIIIQRLNGVNFPKSYTLDVAVTPKGTMLLEVHNFVSCGTYGFYGNELPYMYRDGIDFELNFR